MRMRQRRPPYRRGHVFFPKWRMGGYEEPTHPGPMVKDAARRPLPAARRSDRTIVERLGERVGRRDAFGLERGDGRLERLRPLVGVSDNRARPAFPPYWRK